MQYLWRLVASHCVGIILLLGQAWVLLVWLGGTRGREWGALLFLLSFHTFLCFLGLGTFFQFFFFPLFFFVVA